MHWCRTGIASLDILMIAAAAGFITGILQATGLGFALTLLLVKLGGGNLIVLLIIAALLCIVLGMGMPTIGVYVLLAVLIAPALVELGFDPLAAHMFILYLGMMSMITPPVAIGAFFAASLAGAEPMRTGFTAMRFGWTAYIVPFLFIFSPALLLQGDNALEMALRRDDGDRWRGPRFDWDDRILVPDDRLADARPLHRCGHLYAAAEPDWPLGGVDGLLWRWRGLSLLDRI
jgi:TRAP-type uncharacterized transport system fused permease subunit